MHPARASSAWQIGANPTSAGRPAAVGAACALACLLGACSDSSPTAPHAPPQPAGLTIVFADPTAALAGQEDAIRQWIRSVFEPTSRQISVSGTIVTVTTDVGRVIPGWGVGGYPERAAAPNQQPVWPLQWERSDRLTREPRVRSANRHLEPMRILVVEDDPLLAEAIVEALGDEAYAVDHAATGTDADELATVNDYDLVVLDWTLPPPDGLTLLARWREAGVTIPVLMLTARAGVADRVSGLDAGADDYLPKPFALDELLARVRSLLRRRPQRLAALCAGDVALDRQARQVTIAGVVVPFTAKELGVLEYLLAHQDQVVRREELVEHVWDQSFDAMSNTVDVIVYRVRKKIDGDRPSKLLHTVTGAGWLLSSSRRAPTAPAGESGG